MIKDWKKFTKFFEIIVFFVMIISLIYILFGIELQVTWHVPESQAFFSEKNLLFYPWIILLVAFLVLSVVAIRSFRKNE